MLNFKDAYKKANDSIHGNEELIKKIFEESKKKPIHKINYYTLSSVAAAVILFAGIYGSQYVERFSQITTESAPRSSVVEEKNNIEKAHKISDLEIPEKVLDKKAENEQSKKIVSKSPIASENSVSYEVNTSEKIIPQEPIESEIKTDSDTGVSHSKMSTGKAFLQKKSASEGVEVDANEPAVANVEEFDFQKESSVPFARASGGGGAAAQATKPHEIQQMDKEEYLSYLGTRGDAIYPELPKGMKWSFPESYTIITDGENVINDQNTVIALDDENPERILMLTITKDSTDVMKAFDSFADSVKEYEWGKLLSLYGEPNSEIYIVFDNIYLTVTSSGIPSEELSELIENKLK